MAGPIFPGPGGMKPRLFVALLTPLDPDLRCRIDLLAPHCQNLLARGADGLALFGTTGFGPVFSTPQRTAILEDLIAAGVPADSLIVGTTAASLADMIRLTRHAVEQGCAGCFAMPPFFFRHGSAEGIADLYVRLIEGTAEDRLRLYLYNIPAFHGFPIPIDMLGDLHAKYPGTIAGLKDSSGDWSVVEALLAAYPRLEIYTGIEPMLPRAIDAGGAGAISGVANLVPSLLRALCQAGDEPGRTAALKRTQTLVDALPQDAILPALAGLMAHLSKEPAWANMPPPLRPLPAEQLQSIAEPYREHNEWDPQAASYNG